MSRIKDLAGQRFGRLVVQRMTEKRIRRNVVWLCVCDCGNCVEIRGGDLQSGRTRSCGCLRVDSAKETHLIHGKAHSKIHYIWLSMKNRCFNEKAKNLEIMVEGESKSVTNGRMISNHFMTMYHRFRTLEKKGIP